MVEKQPKSTTETRRREDIGKARRGEAFFSHVGNVGTDVSVSLGEARASDPRMLRPYREICIDTPYRDNSSRAMTIRWIWLVPSTMGNIFESRCIRSTRYSCR